MPCGLRRLEAFLSQKLCLWFRPTARTLFHGQSYFSFARSWYKPGRTCWLEALEMLGAKMSAAYWTGQRVHEEMPGLLVNLCAAEHHTTVGEEAAQVLGWIFVKDNNLHHEDWAACSLRS
mmetsp:Transcript_92970/g.248823  ORF Transcript_92970/g.248823 Transcript_92970/m.248823 type:complete len:120 (+) Transcript_92970:308-667(+)